MLLIGILKLGRLILHDILKRTLFHRLNIETSK